MVIAAGLQYGPLGVSAMARTNSSSLPGGLAVSFDVGWQIYTKNKT